MTLREVAPYVPNVLTEEMLRTIDEDLAAIDRPGGRSDAVFQPTSLRGVPIRSCAIAAIRARPGPRP